MLKERPILFSTPMVQAIVSGNKTQTRRIVKKIPDGFKFEGMCTEMDYSGISGHFEGSHTLLIPCPFGYIGDILWVRETWTLLEEKDCEGMKTRNYYKSDHHNSNDEWFKENYKWHPAIFMPKAVCRIKLKIKNIRIERLNEISQEDAQDEGIKINQEGFHCMNYHTKKMQMFTPEESFETLWREINGFNSWKENPYVWVIEFEKI